jgi:hypothetical protein
MNSRRAVDSQVTLPRASVPAFPDRCVACLQPATSQVGTSHDVVEATSFLADGWPHMFGEGHFDVPVCRRHWLRVAFDFWFHRIGVVAAGMIGIIVHYVWLRDSRVLTAFGELGFLVSLVPCLALYAIIALNQRRWISSGVSGNEARYSFCNARFASAFMEANVGHVRGYSLAGGTNTSPMRGRARGKKGRGK